MQLRPAIAAARAEPHVLHSCLSCPCSHNPGGRASPSPQAVGLSLEYEGAPLRLEAKMLYMRRKMQERKAKGDGAQVRRPPPAPPADFTPCDDLMVLSG